MIEISGKEFPLVFSFDAIASIESQYDASVLEVQEDMSRIDKIYSMLVAALNGAFTKDELKDQDLPPVLVIQGLLKQALVIAYFGDEIPSGQDEDAKKKPAQKKK